MALGWWGRPLPKATLLPPPHPTVSSPKPFPLPAFTDSLIDCLQSYGTTSTYTTFHV